MKAAALRNVDLSSQRDGKRFELRNDCNVRQQRRPLSRIELNHNVDIAAGGFFFASDRAEYGGVQDTLATQFASQFAQEREDSVEGTLTGHTSEM